MVAIIGGTGSRPWNPTYPGRVGRVLSCFRKPLNGKNMGSQPGSPSAPGSLPSPWFWSWFRTNETSHSNVRLLSGGDKTPSFLSPLLFSRGGHPLPGLASYTVAGFGLAAAAPPCTRVSLSVRREALVGANCVIR